MYGQNSVSANLPRILGAGAGEGGGVYIFSIGHFFLAGRTCFRRACGDPAFGERNQLDYCIDN